MTPEALPRIVDEHRIDPQEGMPEESTVVAPPDLAAAADLLEAASAAGTPVTFWGAGSHQGFGHPVDASLIISTFRLNRIIDWQAEDLTIVVEAGLPVAELEALLATRNQSAVLAELPGQATVGGVLAAGISGYRRLRYGPTRDRVLESVVVTGDGRVTTAGGRVVKNVTGYDIPRLIVGSFGSLGLIGQVCLKLWPTPSFAATLEVDDAAAAFGVAYRPLAVLETNDRRAVLVAGTEEEVAGQATDLGSTAVPGLAWPAPPEGEWQAILRVPPASVSDAVARIRGVDGLSFVAAHGVGEVQIGATPEAATIFGELRARAESLGGALVIAGRPDGAGLFDPWGTAPATVDLQRRVKAAFDPAGIANPGRLPGRI